MKEHVIQAEIENLKLTATLFEKAFCMSPETAPMWSISKLKSFHWHSNYEIFFVSQGSLSVITEKETVEVENSLLIIPPFLEHYTATKNVKGYAANFTLEQIEKRSGELFARLTDRLSTCVTVLPLSDDEKFYAEHIAQCMTRAAPLEHIKYFVPLLFSEIFYRMRSSAVARDLDLGKSTKYIDAIDLYISHHYSEGVRLSDVANALHLCTKQITRIIRKEYGCSLSELVARRRLSTACMLLKHTELTVNDVAANVGYVDHETYFYSLFKKKYGMTPMQYRIQIRQAEQTN